MQTNIIEQIKQIVNIVDLADKYNCSPFGRGNVVNTKYNCLRIENTSSLKLYRDSQSWFDFGSSSGGDVIDFVVDADNITKSEAIDKLCQMYGINRDIETNITFKPVETKSIEKEYMTVEVLNKCFLSQVVHSEIDLNQDSHIEQLKTIAPLYIFKDSNSEDINYFKSISRFVDSKGTTVHRFPNSSNEFHTMKYRYYFDDEQNKMIKWRTLPTTKSSYLYSRLTGKDTILVVEGARDYLTACLCGFDVLALYSKNYKFTDSDYLLLQGKRVIFVDDFGENAIKTIHDNFNGDKTYFNHNLMRTFSKCESKDFSDYLYHFKSLQEFLSAFYEVTKTSGTWEDGINKNKILTLEFLDSKPNVEALFEQFIYKGTSTVIHSDPGQGKSTLILAIIKQSIQQKKINKVIYFDADNPPSVLKDRIYNFMGEFGKDVTYWTSALSAIDEMENEMKRLCTFQGQGENVLIVIDTLTRFLNGKSIKNDNDVAPFISLANRLVIDFGATVIIVHHSNKSKGDDGRPIFQGSQKITGDTDATFGLVREGTKLKLFRDKARFGYICDIATMEIDAKELLISNFKAKYIGDGFEDEENEDEDSSEIDITKEQIIKFIEDRDEISMYEIKKYFKATRKDRKIEKLRSDFIFNTIKNNKDIIIWNGESGNKAKYSIDKNSKKEVPEVIEFSKDEFALFDMF